MHSKSQQVIRHLLIGKTFGSKCFLWLWLLLLLMMPATLLGSSAEFNVAMPKGLALCGETVPTGLSDVRESYEKEMLLVLGDKPQAILWLKRSTRFLPFIAQELKKAGMPEDIKYLPIVESALLPHAGSSRGAIGFWQLLPETARNNGLTVDEFIDQRRDLFLSTPAALKYLMTLHDKFSSWTLALAAYNMGEEGLEAEILEQKTDDFYKLYLPLETQRFIFRIQAVKQLIENPKTYGFNISSQDFYKPLVFDTVQVECAQETPIRVVADAAHSYFKEIKDLNPHLRGHYLQAGSHLMRVPKGSAEGFADRFKELSAAHQQEREQRIYIVQEGDSLSSIAGNFNVPLAALLIWNRIDMRKTLRPGDRLVIYPQTDKPHGP
ncbi:MAG: transglycosylase SLT domain-containing protein [Desulfobacteraceae bacterium]|nr:transglycosylase SLT domain-containing protein [Desulfobacteraceae bacterium]